MILININVVAIDPSPAACDLWVTADLDLQRALRNLACLLEGAENWQQLINYECYRSVLLYEG